jgi:putative thiamine transport system ATP-binding protein
MSLVVRDFSITLQGQALLAPFSLVIGAGEIVTLMGPSGSGKTSLLQAIAGGLALPFGLSGQVVVNGRDVTHLPPATRKIGRLFQDDLLFPHLSVGENMLFGLARGPRPQRLAAMRAALGEVELEGFENRAPHTLSGGQRQRVALMRSLLAAPHAMLLDEPFNKLDEALRASMRALTFAKLRASKTPSLLVTHDKADAPKGGRVLVIEKGEVRDV